MRWASAIAASLPEGSSSPLSIVSSLTRLPLGSTPTRRALVGQRLLGHADLGVGRRALDHEQRGHHLRQAGDRQHAVGLAAPQDLAGVEVEEQAAARRVLEASPAPGRTSPASASAQRAVARVGRLRRAVGDLQRPGDRPGRRPAWRRPRVGRRRRRSRRARARAIRTPARLIGRRMQQGADDAESEQGEHEPREHREDVDAALDRARGR